MIKFTPNGLPVDELVSFLTNALSPNWLFHDYFIRGLTGGRSHISAKNSFEVLFLNFLILFPAGSGCRNDWVFLFLWRRTIFSTIIFSTFKIFGSCAILQSFFNHINLSQTSASSSLDAFMHLYKRVCPSDCPSIHFSICPYVRPFVCPSVRMSVHFAFS